jgi:hypothetical protein
MASGLRPLKKYIPSPGLSSLLGIGSIEFYESKVGRWGYWGFLNHHWRRATRLLASHQTVM